MTEPNNTVLALVRDLMLASRITTAAKQAGVPVVTVRDPATLSGQSGRLLVVDLNLSGAIEAAGAWGRQHAAPVVGFVAHVDTAAIRQAREAGIERVLARSAFVEQLPSLLRGA